MSSASACLFFCSVLMKYTAHEHMNVFAISPLYDLLLMSVVFRSSNRRSNCHSLIEMCLVSYGAIMVQSRQPTKTQKKHKTTTSLGPHHIHVQTFKQHHVIVCCVRLGCVVCVCVCGPELQRHCRSIRIRNRSVMKKKSTSIRYT